MLDFCSSIKCQKAVSKALSRQVMTAGLQQPAETSAPIAESSGQSSTPVARVYAEVRRASETLCTPLAVDDYMLQSMPDASPVKWHLAHTSWFFETFVLANELPDYEVFRPEFQFLFNSYYNAVGPRWPRPERGLLSRPTIEEVYRYRSYVDEQMEKLFERATQTQSCRLIPTVLLGINHEQQHQELIVTDLKHAWAANPLRPVLRQAFAEERSPPPLRWLSFPEGLSWIGHEGAEFAFDNETPRHRVFVHGFELASRPVTNAEYLAFMNDAGYERSERWLSDGWTARQAKGWTAPLYWQQGEGQWSAVTLSGLRPLAFDEPVCHVSYYEADAFARWAGARLPTEAEWETAAANAPVAGHFLESNRFHPAAGAAPDDRGPLYKLHGDVWQWTASPYVGYPGYRPAVGALGEYNGKFMCNQFVLRGASCATPRSHARHTYRNFFPPDARWQFTGLRLARDVPE
jgi:ergothioneine biosynthesis protein EgtB